MRLLVKVGYYEVLFDADINTGAVLEAFGNAKVVESDGYGKERIFKPSETTVEVVLVSDTDPGLPENQNSAAVAAARKIRELESTIRELKSKIKE